MVRTTLAALGFVLAAGSAHAQTPSPSCIAFVPEGANGAITLCFPENMSAALRGVLNELIERDKVQADRHQRVVEECGPTASQLDDAKSRSCRARVAREVPFPAPSDAAVTVLQRYHLVWE